VIPTDSDLQFHLKQKLLLLEELGTTWDFSLSQLPFSAIPQLVDRSMLSNTRTEVINIHNSIATHNVESDCDDIVVPTENMTVVFEVVKGIDEAEECVGSEAGSDDSIDTYESK
jgi:hypothetical protein